jgi:hypothetical protein
MVAPYGHTWDISCIGDAHPGVEAGIICLEREVRA